MRLFLLPILKTPQPPPGIPRDSPGPLDFGDQTLHRANPTAPRSCSSPKTNPDPSSTLHPLVPYTPCRDQLCPRPCPRVSPPRLGGLGVPRCPLSAGAGGAVGAGGAGRCPRGAQTAPRDRGQGTRDRGQEGFAFRLRPMKVFKKRGCGMGTSQAQGFESSALKEWPRPLFPRRKIGGDKAPFAIILFLLSRRKTVNLTNLAHLAAWEIVLRGK